MEASRIDRGSAAPEVDGERIEPACHESYLHIGDRILKIGVMNLNETEFSVPAGIKVATLSILSRDQAKHLAPVDPNLCRYLERKFAGKAEEFLSQLYKGPSEINNSSKFWFPTPEDEPVVSKLNGFEKRIYHEITK